MDLKGDFYLFVLTGIQSKKKKKKNRKPHFEFGIGSTNKEFLKFDLVLEVILLHEKFMQFDWLSFVGSSINK